MPTRVPVPAPIPNGFGASGFNVDRGGTKTGLFTTEIGAGAVVLGVNDFTGVCILNGGGTPGETGIGKTECGTTIGLTGSVGDCGIPGAIVETFEQNESPLLAPVVMGVFVFGTIPEN